MDRREYLAAASLPVTALTAGCLVTDTLSCFLRSPSVDVSVAPTAPAVGEEVVLTGSANCVNAADNEDPESFRWAIGEPDEYSYTGKILTRRFDSPGNYPVTLKYYQGFGTGPTETVTVDVRRRPDPIDVETDEVSILLQANRTQIGLDESAILLFSATNLIGNRRLTIQLIFETPDGMSVSGTGFVQEGGGQYTSTYEIEPGGQENLRIEMQANERGTYNVTGEVVYYFGDAEADTEVRQTTVPVVVE